ncbi:hypothetical protein [Nocardioides sp. YIM 152315]|uniref:hypothetical protein n=1 Tax=Nocardioides sp. YIM 152315 TaxID=3031760 RepID=UPI0023D9DAC1|nr:hypothetical protein [Nocardioides sp. YIM 152315]MDF1605908.1 hypothetical protein [Nocardioides sp. YIM 152315]
MALPLTARHRLTEPIRRGLSDRRWLVGSDHTLPIEPRVWAAYADAVKLLIGQLSKAMSPPLFGPERGFDDLRRSMESLLEIRDELAALIVALTPFQPFPAPLALELGEAVDASIELVLSAVEAGEQLHREPDLTNSVAQWPMQAATVEGHALRDTFVMTRDPVDDAQDFSPSRVLEAYKYGSNGGLLRVLLPHIASLGIEPVDDVLTLVCVCGWIAASPNPVQSYIVMMSMRARLAAASAQGYVEVIDAIFERLDVRDEALRQSRRRAYASLKAAVAERDAEAQAHLRVEAYKRLLEGAVREYVWMMRALRQGTWSTPPTLGPLRDAVVADRDWLSRLVEPILLTKVRNGQAHEALEWDGRRGTYVVERETVSPSEVREATIGAAALARGCEAALAHHLGSTVKPTAALPMPGEVGRMQGWRRAEAFMGTNGLRVDHFGFNSNRIELRLERFDQEDINPCFAAMLLTNRVLPGFDEFEVYRTGEDDAVVRVSREALDLTDPAWSKAVTSFAALPLGTFLPANLDARRRLETESVAVRSVAWMGADDVLSAIDGAPVLWDRDTLELVRGRVSVAALAIEGCRIAAPSQTRLRVLAETVHQLEVDLAALGPTTTCYSVDAFASTERIRTFWETWGPVLRLPNVLTARREIAPEDDPQPSLKASGVPRWSTL